MNSEVFMARQPIYDGTGQVFAYELLYRADRYATSANPDDQISVKALINSLVDIGLDELVGDRVAFINVDEEILTSDAIDLLPVDRVVLEILETTELNEEVRTALLRLLRRGYKIAFDDFTFSPEQMAFLPYVNMVKVDLLGTDQRTLLKGIPDLVNRDLEVLAEKVETAAMLKFCINLGCHYFQGYFFSRPQVVKGKGLDTNQMALLHILGRLQDPDIGLPELERIISSDVGFAYRLLRLVNSASMGVTRRVETVRQAVFMLGFEQIGALAGLLTMSSTSTGSEELVTMALVRARMCERLAAVSNFEEPAKHFTVGLLSVLDALVGMPMKEILAKLPLSEDIKSALLDLDIHAPLARTLCCAKAFEQGQFELANQVGEKPQYVNESYRAAVMWANQARQDLAA